MKLSRRLMCAALLMPGFSMAGGGDDHEHGPATAAPAAPIAQALRTEAASELFELVAVLEGDKLVIHLDRFASNEPVTGAKIDVEGGPLKTTAAVEHDGVYMLPAPGLAAPGTHPLVFTVRSGAVSDLLTGDLVVGAAAPTAPSAEVPITRWAAAAAALLLLATGFGWRRRRAARAGARR